MRLGWKLPVLLNLQAAHGPLMVCGFLGTLICLERAVALKNKLGFIVPFLTGIGALLVVCTGSIRSGGLFFILGSLGLVFIFAVILSIQYSLATSIIGFGALLWLTGNILWFSGRTVSSVIPWWIGFLVLTIAGERLELARMLVLSKKNKLLLSFAMAIFLSGIIVSTANYSLGIQIMGSGMIALSLWLWIYDIARRTVKQKGLTRFIAVCLLSGYFWLGLSGIMALLFGKNPGGFYYDAVIHGVFLGFVFSLIFGHAPIIFPAILSKTVSFEPRFYAHVLLLHLSLALRVASDLLGWANGWKWGGLFNVAAILLFFISTASAVFSHHETPSSLPAT